MSTRRRTYLYLYTSKTIIVAESQLGSGKTLTATICATAAGNATAIGTLTETATAVSGDYTLEFTSADLVSQLLATYDTETVYIHLTDGVQWRDVYDVVVTAIDPDLMAPLL